MEQKNKKVVFLSMLLGTLRASLLGDLLKKNLSRKVTVRAGEGTARAGEGIEKSSNSREFFTTSFNKF